MQAVIKKFVAEKKWKIGEGFYVEDILHNYALTCPREKYTFQFYFKRDSTLQIL